MSAMLDNIVFFLISGWLLSEQKTTQRANEVQFDQYTLAVLDHEIYINRGLYHQIFSITACK
jgi:hypothetical protein